MITSPNTQTHKKVCRCLINLFIVDCFCFVILLLTASLLLPGCSIQHPQITGISQTTFRVLPEQYQNKAMEYERRGFWREALLSWWVVQSFYPGDQKIKDKIKSLREKCLKRANDHIATGEHFYKNGRFKDARREFLLALTYNQDNELALDYLTKRMQPHVFREYTIEKGDTLSIISNKLFHDPNKAYLLRAFNDIGPNAKLLPNTKLQVLLLGADFPKKKIIEQVISKKSAPKQPTKSTKLIPLQKSNVSSDIINYQKAKKYLEQEEYHKSLQVLRSVDINFRDVPQLIAATEVFIQQEADAHYRKGISYFLSEDLDNAILEWQEVLRLSPNHLKAKKDLRNVKKLQKKRKRY